MIQDKKKAIYNRYLNDIRYLAYRGIAEAQFDLAGHYEDIGFWGMPNPYYNPKKCFYWYSKAVSNNHPEAHNNLASLYEEGRGCNIDLEKALELYELAALLGSPSGKKNFKIMKKQMSANV